MAKIQNTMSFSNVLIDLAAMELIEHDKNGDEIERFSIYDILSHWDGQYGISVTFKQQDNFQATSGDRD